MTFWLGFMTAVALIAVGIIVASMVYVKRKEKAGRAALHALFQVEDAALIAAFQAVRQRVAETPGPMTDRDTEELAAITERLEQRGIDIGPLLKLPIPSARKDVH